MKKQSQSFIRPIFHQVFVTSSVTTFTTIGAGFVDTIIVSYFLGVDAIAAAGLGYSFYYLAGIIYGCIATGFKSLASRSLARGDTEDFRHIYSVSISLAVLVSCLVMGLIYCFTGPLVWLLGARGSSESLAGMTSSYLAGLAVGLPALTLNSVLSTALYFDNGTAAVTTANIVSMAADILLDIAAVLTGAGMLGIGLASSVSAWMGLIVLALKSRKSSLLVFTLTKPKKGELREMVHLGSERIFARLISFIKPLILNPMILSLGGTAAMAALSMRNSLMNFVAIPDYGIGDALNVTADISYNIRSRSELRETGHLAHLYTLSCALIPGLIISFLSPWLPALLMPDGDSLTRQLLTFALLMAGIKLFFETLLSARVCFLQAIGRIREAKAEQFLISFATVVVCVALLGYLSGAMGIMAAYTVADLLSMFLIYDQFAIRKKDPRVTLDDFMEVTDECDVSPGDLIELKVSTPEECALTAEQVLLFCRGHGLDHAASTRAGLVAEEALTLLLKLRDSSSAAPPVKFHMTCSGGKARMHFRFHSSPGRSLFAEIANLKAAGEESSDHLEESIIRAYASQISQFNSMGLDNLIIVL